MNGTPEGPKKLNLFDEVQQICREFRRALKSGERRQIEEYLGKVGESAQAMLFQNLLHTDLEYRRRVQESPSSDDYIARFPQFSGVIRQAFFESTMMSQEYFGDTPDSAEPTFTLGMPAARKIGDYELLRELGRGGFGVVYEARHLKRGDRVALKTLPAILDGHPESSRDAERLHRFRREFRSLSEINHPHLAGMQTLEVDGNQWFFTMDLVDGVDFLDYVRPGGKLDEQRLRDSLPQLARGIIALHERGIVHRDLKPSNVLVSSDGHLVILDFGLVAELQNLASQTLSMGTKHFAGTPRYAAPEQATGQRTAAVDWYAVGVMLCEAITGEPAFKGSGVELLVAKQTHDPPSFAEREDVPEDLAKLIDGMLRRDPKHRPGDEAVAKALGVHLESMTHDSSADSSMASVSVRENEEFLVGRESQLAELDRILKSFSQSRQPEVVFISGRSGEGKTSLAEKFLSGVRRDGKTLVLAGRCYDRESVPFKAIDCLIDPLVAYLRARSIDDLNKLLSDDIGMLAQLFPVLRRVEAIAERAALTNTAIDSRQIRYRAFAAFRELLTSIGRSTPVILFIDDLQWGDADSATALHEIIRPPDSPAVMLLGSYRSDEAGESPFLTDWREKQADMDHSIDEKVIEVAPLTQQQCVSLIASRVGVDAETLRKQAEELFADTRGNPYFLEQLIEGFDQETGRFQAVPLDDIIARKLTRLPSAASPLLEAIAIAGQAVALDEAATVSDQTTNTFATVTHMRSERLVRLIGSGKQQRVDTYHDKIRETVLSSMTSSDRTNAHLRFVETIETSLGISGHQLLQTLSESDSKHDQCSLAADRVFDLAHHCLEAGDASAFVYQILAAEQASESYALDDALRFYELAERRLPETASQSLQFRLFMAKGRVLLWHKITDRAIELYERALTVSASGMDSARAYKGIGDAQKQTAHFDQANHFYDQALANLNASRPRTRIGTLISVIANLLKIVLIPPNYQVKRNAKQRQNAKIRHEVLFEMSPYAAEKDVLESPDIFMRDGTASFQTGQQYLVAHGYAQAAYLLSGYGAAWIGNLLLKRSGRIESVRNDPEVQGNFLYTQGVAEYWGGALQDAEQSLKKTIPLLRRCGRFYTQLVATHMLRHTYAYIAPADDELEIAHEVLNLAKEVDNAQCICWGFYDVASANARCGSMKKATEYMQFANDALTDERFYMTETIRGSTHGYVLLQASQYQQARDVALKAWNQVWRCPIDVTMFCLPVLIESLAGAQWTEPPAESDAPLLKKLLRYASFLHLSYPNHRAHLHRVCGRGHMALGNRRKAVRKLEKSVSVAGKKNMHYQHARALLDLAAVKEEYREENRIAAIEMLMRMGSVIPYAERWLLGDQYDSGLVAPSPNEHDFDAANPKSEES